MAPVKIKYIVSFSSQDPNNGVDNLCTVTDSPKPWLCSAQDRSGILKAELQMERAITIGYIDVGNCGSALIQIDVGSSSWSHGRPYVTLLPTTTLMSSTDSRQGTGRTGVRMFKKADFLPAGAEGSWDRVRITCTQPFNRHTKFGLSFLHIRSPLAEPEGGAEEKLGGDVVQKTPEEMASKVREWLSSPTVQRAFFGPMAGENISEAAQLSVVPEKVWGPGVGLSRTARMVCAAARSAKCLLPTAALLQQNQSGSTQPNDTKDEEADNSSVTTEKQTCKRVKRKLSPKTRPISGSCSSSMKRGRAAAGTQSLSNCPRPCRTPHPPQSEHQSSMCPETTCPICGGHFSGEYLPLHASSCQGDEEWPVSGDAVMSGSSPGFTPGSLPSPASSPGEEEVTACPLCSFRFPLSEIEQHASDCGEPAWIWVD